MNNQLRVGLFAIKDIKSGNELTFNYNLECRGDEKTKCLCNSKNCSDYIGVQPNKMIKKKTIKKRKLISGDDNEELEHKLSESFFTDRTQVKDKNSNDSTKLNTLNKSNKKLKSLNL